VPAVTRPFRFGVQAFSAESPAAWRDLSRRAEALGYSALHLADHYIGAGPQLAKTNHPLQGLAAIPAMTVAAEATTTLKIGCRVFCVDYHVPTVLVKNAATIDWFSGGRLELGLGAGWLAGEYEAMGLTMDSAGTRVGRLEEMVTLTKALLAPGEVDHRGTHLTAFGFQGEPQPQHGVPPIMVGGGSPRVLRMAGRLADIVSLNFDNSSGVIGPIGVTSGMAGPTAQKVAWVAEGAASADRPLPELEIGAYFTFVVPNPDVVAEGFGKAFGMTAADVMAHPHALVGTVDHLVDELQRRRDEYGISYVTVNGAAMEAFAPVVAALSGRT
jgi:probable F420-dependent oxidoreductase